MLLKFIAPAPLPKVVLPEKVTVAVLVIALKVEREATSKLLPVTEKLCEPAFNVELLPILKFPKLVTPTPESDWFVPPLKLVVVAVLEVKVPALVKLPLIFIVPELAVVVMFAPPLIVRF